MIEILDMKDVKDATPEELEELRRKGFLPKTRSKRISGKPLTPYERTILLDLVLKDGQNVRLRKG